MEVIYTEHLNLRLKLRNIPSDYPKLVYQNPEQEFIDDWEGSYIAIKKLKYNGKLRNIMIAYEEKDSKIQIITIHPITEEKIISRLIIGRWRKK